VDSDKRFPFLTPQERNLILSFEEEKSNESKVVNLMLELSQSFRDSESEAQRVKARAKLLGLAGLYELIPVERFEAAKNEPLSLTMLELRMEEEEEPLLALMKCGEVPFDLIASFPGLQEFFEIKLPDGSTTYRERFLKKQNDIGGVLVVLKSDMSEEVVGYVSASSEPLTRSVIINPWAESDNKEIRDFASIAYDLVMQIEFLEIFYQCTKTLNRVAIQASMRLEGLRFVLDIFSYLLKRAIDGGHVQFEIRETEVLLKNSEGEENLELCMYLKYLLYGLAINTIAQLDKILGSEFAEVEVQKVLGGHPLGFDPRRIEMKILAA
jgi:hypothetical protein